MPQFIEADVIQKIATPAEWGTLLGTKIPYKGQIMLVSDSTGKVVNIKVGDGTNNFAGLEYMFDTIQANVNYVQVTGTALPTPTITSGFSVVGEGTYTYSGQSDVVVPAGDLGILFWDGTAWSLQDSIALPTVTGTDVIVAEEIPKGKAVTAYAAAKSDLLTKADTTIETGKNKFNKDTVVAGNYMKADGTIVASAANNYSAPILIDPAKTYQMRSVSANTGARFLTVFDKDMVAIPSEGSDVSISSKTFTNPNAKYIIVSVSNTAIADFQIEVGSSSSPYEPYTEKKVLDESQLPANVRKTDVKITQPDLSFAELQEGSKNIFDINAPDVSLDSYLNTTGGVTTPSGTYNTTGFIDLSGRGSATQIRVSRQRFSCFYDSNKQFISGTYNDTSGNNIILTIPSGAMYLRVTCPYTAVAGVVHWPILMINYGTSILPYEPYSAGYYLLKNTRAELDTSDSLLVWLPENIYVAVGRTIEIYNAQCAWAGNLDDYHFHWSGVGKSMKRKWTVTGTSGAIGSYTLTLRVYDNNMRQVATASTTVRIVTNVISAAFSINPIGDSLTNTKPWQGELITLSGGMISYQGTRGAVQTAPNRTHEGRSGAVATYYLGNNSYTFDASGQVGNDGRTQDLNPYWNPNTSDVDWNYYKSNYNKNPDKIMIWLGTNGISLDPTANVNAIKTFVDKLRSTGAASIPMYICLTLFRGDQNGIGNQTGSDGYVANSAWKLEEDRKVFNLQVALYDALKNYSNLHFIPISLCHDSEFNFTPAGASTPVNPRAWQTESLPSEATHPQLAGYNQIADIMFSVLAGTQ